MAGLGGALGLLVGERRLVDEHVGLVRGDPHRVARHRVPGDDDLAPGAARAHHLLGLTPRIVSPRCTRPNSGPGVSPRRGRLRRVEGAGPLRLEQRVAKRGASVATGTGAIG